MSIIENKYENETGLEGQIRHDEIVALLKEIRDAINVFKEFVLEVTPQDAKDDIKKLN